MKKIFFSFLATIMCMSLTLTGQKVMDQGYIKLEITDATSDNEQVAMGLEMMKGTQTEIFFMGGKSLSKMNMMGGMFETTTLFDNSTEKMDMLINAMGQKMHIESTAEERNMNAGEQAAIMKEMEVTYDETDTKEILGHKCVKANVAHPTMNNTMSFSMYVAKDIKANSELIQGLQDIELQGFPLEYVMEMPQMTMTITAVEMNEEVDDTIFTLDTGGYQKMTFKEFQEKMQAMGGGGFGF